MRTLGLTEKQEAFCRAIVSGKSPVDAYVSAYNTTKRNVASVESLKLMKRDDITKRIQEIGQPVLNHIQNRAIGEREKQISEIKERIRLCKQRDDEQSLIRYYDMLNKIYGLYKDTDEEKKTENTLAQLDTSALQKVLEA